MNNDTKDRLLKILAIVFSVGALLFVVFLISNRTDYEKIERQMVKNAKEYVSKHKIKVTNQEFVFIRDLDVEPGTELCSKASGVVITNIGGSIKYYPYLKCIDYESKILRNTTNYIELNGPEVALVNQGTLYFDQGYTKKRNDIKIETVGEVPDEVGAYTINYVVTKDGKQKTIVKRIVIVSDVDTAIVTDGFSDKEKPNLVLKGETDIVLKVKEKYVEPGYVAYDYKDGYLTGKVEVNYPAISTDKEGKYELVYTVKNSRGEVATVKRNVSVVKKIGDLNINITTEDKGAAINESIIEISVSGSDFDKIILPDGMATDSSMATYTATKNGVYTFKVIDKFKNQLNKSIVVENIDSKPPTGTCKAEKVDLETVFKVVAEDDRGVMSVDYIVNGNETGFLAATSYKTKEKVTIATAVIKDVAGNTTRISCPIEDNSSINDTYTFKNDNNRKIIACDSYTTNDKEDLDARLVKAINDAGYGTRAGVVEAARFLAGGLEYRIPYSSLRNTTIDPDQIIGLYDKVGFNIANTNGWGCKVKGLLQGMNIESFIKWAFINAGATLTDNYEAVSVSDNFGKIKPGDILLTECKDCENKYSVSGLVIGIEANKLYVAEITSKGLVVTELSKLNLPKDGTNAFVSLYKYKSDGKVTNMWK